MFRNYHYFKRREFLISLTTAVALLVISFFINFYAGIYATERASNAVTDLILSNIPIFDVGGLFVYGTLLFWIFVSLLCLSDIKKMPFAFKSIALFMVIRALFISLTHIGPPTHIAFYSAVVSKFTFDGDLFFSGHTGLPFLMALIFWNEYYLRLFFLASSVFFGTIVLLGHLHYSIDVLAAFFITYTIYHLAESFFKKDKQIFISGLGI